MNGNGGASVRDRIADEIAKTVRPRDKGFAAAAGRLVGYTLVVFVLLVWWHLLWRASGVVAAAIEAWVR